MKKIFCIIILINTTNLLIAQESDEGKEKISHYTPSPDFPGALVLDWGLNYFNKNSAIMDIKPWSSPTINLYYMYDIRLKKSRFSVNIGIGVGSEKYSFLENITLKDSLNFTTIDSINNNIFYNNSTNTKKSQFITNYIDLPLEIRIHSRKNDQRKSFYLALGAKVGFRIAGKSKIIYSEFGKTKKNKNLYHFNASSIRYGVSARLGYGPFNFWGYYALNPFFANNKIVGVRNPSTFSFGVSLASF